MEQKNLGGKVIEVVHNGVSKKFKVMDTELTVGEFLKLVAKFFKAENR